MTAAEVDTIMMGMSKMNQEVSEAMPAAMSPRGATAAVGDQMPQPMAVQLKTGNFRNADNFHQGSGRAGIFQSPDGSNLLRLEDFKVTNGPDLHVLLTAHPNPAARQDLKDADYIDLGKLKGNQGNQNYLIPDEVEIDEHMSVVIYCMPFHVVFSVAPLEGSK